MPDHTRKYLKPKLIKVAGREEPELARLSFPGSKRELPEKGGWRPWVGNEGNYWRRREKEGSVVEAEAPRAETPKTQTSPKSSTKKGKG